LYTSVVGPPQPSMVLFVHGLEAVASERDRLGNLPRFVFEDFLELDVGMYQ